MNGLDGFLELARARRSVREFQDRPVPRPLIERLLEAATWAPSASNRQDWRFVVVTAAARRAQLAEAVQAAWAAKAAAAAGVVAEGLQAYAANFAWFGRAPVVIAVAAKQPESFLRELFPAGAERVAGTATSAAMAAQNLLLAAHSAGLGACCLTGPLAAEAELLELLGWGRRHQLVCLLALGYPLAEPPPRPRQPVEAMARYDA